jgi:UPF0755 protein
MNTRKAVLRVGSICLKVAVFVLICFGLVSLGQTTYRYTHAVFSEEAFEEAPGKDIRINIPEDVSIGRFAQVLEENGVIEDAKIFKLQMKMADFGNTVKAGTYDLNTSMKPSQMFKLLSKANEDK